MTKFYYILMYLCFPLLMFSSSKKMFNENFLNNPIKHSGKVESFFTYEEIKAFNPTPMANTAILENGYAKSKIINKSQWDRSVKNRKVKRIDIIFTKYPRKKKDWITNYYELLGDRLKELFKLDPSLNSKDIEWNLVLQTDCEVEYKAMRLFHGILIQYEMKEEKSDISEEEKEKIEIEKKKEEIRNRLREYDKKPLNKRKKRNYKLDYNKEDFDFGNTRMKMKKPKMKKPKRVKLPKCPDFY